MLFVLMAQLRQTVPACSVVYNDVLLTGAGGLQATTDTVTVERGELFVPSNHPDRKSEQ